MVTTVEVGDFRTSPQKGSIQNLVLALTAIDWSLLAAG
jgi:hypothetical protein